MKKSDFALFLCLYICNNIFRCRFMNKNRVKIIVTSFVSCFVMVLSSCGQKPHVHTFSEEWTYDTVYHWHAATCGHDVVNAKNKHSYGSWVIDEVATEEHDGTRHRDCKVCDYVESETYKYSVAVPAERVYIANTTIDLFNGYTYTMHPVVMPVEAMKNIQYEIQNPAILSIEDDVALAKGVGNTLVYAYNDENENEERDEDEKFTVVAFALTNPEPNSYITITEKSVELEVDETVTLHYSKTNIDSYGYDYGFYSEDETICTISGGVVKGHSAGTTRVSVSLKGYRAYCDVTVTDKIDSKGLRASEIVPATSVVMNKGDTSIVSYYIYPAESVDGLASLTSNNPDVVKVNEDKSITALKGGSAVLTFTTENNKTATSLVTVKDDAQTTGSYYNNYYGNLTWENGDDLISKLHDIISANVTPLKFDTPNWESNQKADQDLYDHSYVYSVYTDEPTLKTDTKTGWQREHAFAASLMTGVGTGVSVTDKGRATDFHNLFASDASGNTSRGNKNFGYTNKESIKYSTSGNSCYAGDVFEANDADKGRLARAIFYMAVMYNDYHNADVSEKWTYKGPDTTDPKHTTDSTTVHILYEQEPINIIEEDVGYSHVSLDNFMYNTSDSVSTLVEYYRNLVRDEDPEIESTNYDSFRQKAYQKYVDSNSPYAIGHLSDLLKWNSFGVDHVEMQHNESVFSDNSAQARGTQGNRNPFVDYPQLVDYAFGDLRQSSGSLSQLVPSYLALEMDQDEIHHYSVDSESLPKFESGTKPTVDDFNLKAIKNDLSEGVLDKSKISVEDYTFTDADVASGKVITITTDKNTLRVPCKVTSEAVITFDTCSWNHIDDNTSGHNKDCYGSFDANGVSNSASFSGLDFVVTLDNPNVASNNKITNSGTNGTKFGTASSPNVPEGLTLESKNAISIGGKTNINAIFVIASTASSKTYNYEIFIGDESVKSDTFSGSNVELKVLLDSGHEKQGKVKIVFSNVTAAINIRGLAINAIA